MSTVTDFIQELLADLHAKGTCVNPETGIVDLDMVRDVIFENISGVTDEMVDEAIDEFFGL